MFKLRKTFGRTFGLVRVGPRVIALELFASNFRTYYLFLNMGMWMIHQRILWHWQWNHSCLKSLPIQYFRHIILDYKIIILSIITIKRNVAARKSIDLNFVFSLQCFKFLKQAYWIQRAIKIVDKTNKNCILYILIYVKLKQIIIQLN